MSYVQHGIALDYTPATGVAAGEVVTIGALVGVASSPIAAGELGSVNVGGVFSIPKPTGAGTDYAQGAKVSLFGGLAVTGTTGVAMGYVAKAAATGDHAVNVLLVPGA